MINEGKLSKKKEEKLHETVFSRVEEAVDFIYFFIFIFYNLWRGGKD